MTTQATKNEPTWLEYLIVYLVLGALAVFVYSSVLSPRGYTFAAGWATLRGQKKPDAENQAAKKPPEKSKAMEVDMPAAMVEPEMTPMPKATGSGHACRRALQSFPAPGPGAQGGEEIGRASCRERV